MFSYIVPQWGGVYILNNITTQSISVEQMAQPIGTFVHQLRSLLGIPSTEKQRRDLALMLPVYLLYLLTIRKMLR